MLIDKQYIERTANSTDEYSYVAWSANLIKEEITEGWPGCLFAINENWAFLYFISVDLGARIFIQDDNFSYDANNWNIFITLYFVYDYDVTSSST